MAADGARAGLIVDRRLNFQVQRRIEFDAPEGPQVIYMGIWT